MTMELLTHIIIGLIAILIIILLIILINNRELRREVNSLYKSYDNLTDDLKITKETNRLLTDSVEKMGNLIFSNQETQVRVINEQMDSTKHDMNDKLEEMSNRLENMYKSLGEMKSLSLGVNDLKKVLSNVKTRGMLGETQLKAILEDILSPEQYALNVETIPNSNKRVEFAIKFPGDDGTVWLPIDSKFPGETFSIYRQACENGDSDLISITWKELEKTIKKEAKDIREKYIEVPFTTEFGIMFLPFEGLYSEVVNHNLLETLQRDFKVVIAGPSTMAALLNSFQMGFRTLAIEKHSSEVWELLGAIKTEFSKYRGVLEESREAIQLADRKLEDLSTKRTRAIEKKLKSVEALDDFSSQKVLEIENLNY